MVAGVTAAAQRCRSPDLLQPRGFDVHLVLHPGPVTDWTSAAKSDTEAFGRFFRAMLDSGVYLPPSQFEAAFLSAAHTEEDIETNNRGRKASVRDDAGWGQRIKFEL